MTTFKPTPRTALTTLLGAALSLSGCAVDPKTGAQSFAGLKVSDDPCSSTGTTVGAILGGVAGAVLANQVNHSAGTKVVGIAVGAAAGGLIGRDVDQRRCALYKIAQKHNLEMTVTNVVLLQGALPPPGVPVQVATATSSASSPARPVVSGLSVSVREAGHQFESGSDRLTAEAHAYFNDIADQYVPSAGASAEALAASRGRRILLVGHTDDTGSSRGNADLSERRAMAVATVFRDHGLSDGQLFYQGAGETLPIADNHTDDGRAKNRRVEIVDLTDDQALRTYLATRPQHLEFYRPDTASLVSARDVARDAVVPALPTSPDTTSISHLPATAASAAGASARRAAPTTKQANGAAGAATAKATSTSTGHLPTHAAPATLAATTGRSAFMDFGGAPATSVTASADFGSEIVAKPGMSLLPTAQASDGPVVPSCSTDRPRVSNGVKSLRNQKDIVTADYMPGLYHTSWMDSVNGHLVGLSDVAVLRDGGAPANQPNLYIYRDYKAGSGAKPDYTGRPEVNAYRGDKALLYRLFVNGPVKCIDVLFPYDNSGEAHNSNLFYDRPSALYVAAIKPKLAR